MRVCDSVRVSVCDSECVIVGACVRASPAATLTHAVASTLTKNIADSEVLNEVSEIVLKIDFVFVIGTAPFQFSLKVTPDSGDVRACARVAGGDSDSRGSAARDSTPTAQRLRARGVRVRACSPPPSARAFDQRGSAGQAPARPRANRYDHH
jgi:hypothetical protein